MAYTALQAANIVLKRVGVVAGDAGAITSFTDTAHQREIDVLLQVWNEIIDEAYAAQTLAKEVSEQTITLTTDTREYTLEPDFEKFVEPAVFINATDNNRLSPYPGGYTKMYADQPDPSDHTGQPHFFVINNQNGKLRLDKTPTADEDTDIYTALYEKRLHISLITDTFPCSDDAVDALVSPVAEIWRAIMNGDAREGSLPRSGMARALKAIRQGPTRRQYGRHAHRARIA